MAGARRCGAVFDDDAVVVIDAGNTAIWANFYHGLRESPSPFVFIPDEDVKTCVERGVRDRNLTGTCNLEGDGAMMLPDMARAMGKPYFALPAALVRRELAVPRRLGVAPAGPEQALFPLHRPVLDDRRLRQDFGFSPTPSREVFELYRRARPLQPPPIDMMGAPPVCPPSS